MKQLILSLLAFSGLAASQANAAIIGVPLGNAFVTFDGPSDQSTTSFVESGVTINLTNGGKIQDSGTNDGTGAPPTGTSGNYLTVLGNTVASIEFSTVQNYVGFLWGSIDTYNSVTFFNGVLSVGTVSGATVLSSFSGDQSPSGTDFINFSSADFGVTGFTRFELSGSSNSFEIDNISFNSGSNVPEGGATLALLGSLMGGMMAVRRFKK